jgi:leucine dehydrogenase
LGAKLSIADVRSDLTEHAAKEFGANVVPTESIHKLPCDVFSPCALGAIVDDNSINELQTTIIAGSANNQLAHSYHGNLLHEKGILYAPDYVINAGGLIYAANRYLHTPEQSVEQQIDGIHTALLAIFNRSARENRSTSEIADALVNEKLGLVK